MRNDFGEAFHSLGESIDRTWSKENRRKEAFAEIAFESLKDSAILANFDRHDLIHWVFRSFTLPEQYDLDFGQPPINVYVSPDFYIHVLFWLDATTSIHEHGFSGAFGVLEGSSVLSAYTFQPVHKLCDALHLGNLDFTGSEVLRKGDVRIIYPAERGIHALFHLDRPSLSVVVRSRKWEGLNTQFSFIKPALAFDPFYKPQPMLNQLRMLESLRLSDPATFWKAAAGILESCDPWMLYQTLQIGFRDAYSEAQNWAKLLEIAGAHLGGEIIDLMKACLAGQQRELGIVSFRSKMHNREHRFFLALLLNVPNRDIILELIEREFHTEPVALIEKWIRELVAYQVPTLDLDPLSVQLLILATRCPNLAEAMQFIQRSASDKAEVHELLAEVWSEVKKIDLFRPLFPAAQLAIAGD
jgi:hypothetical protein